MAIGLAQSAIYGFDIRNDFAEKRTVRSIGLLDLLVWAYRDQRVYQDGDTVDDRRYLKAGSIMAGLERLNELGTHVDGGGHSITDPHPDAATVHRAVCRLADYGWDGQVAAGLIIEYAHTARAPERPELGAGTIQPMRNKRGGMVMSYWDWDTGERLPVRSGRQVRLPDGRTCQRGQACEVVFDQTAELDLHLREHYDLWAVGLAFVAQKLTGLKTWIVKPYQPLALTGCSGPALRLKKRIDVQLGI